MKIVFMGNPVFAVPSLKKLAASNHKILAVITNPPKPAGRGRSLLQSPVASFAQDSGINIIEIDDLRTKESNEILSGLNADVFAVVAYRILPKNIIAIPPKGVINLHGSLLPKYRGAAPIQWSLINGDEYTGLTTFFIEPQVDKGKLLLQKRITIDGNDTYGSLSAKMSELGAELLMKTIDKMENDTLKSIAQNDAAATYAPKITPALKIIDWQSSAREIHNLIRGLSPSPGAQTTISDKSLKIFKTNYIEEDLTFGIGTVAKITKNQFSIQTGAGQLIVHEVQLAGKKQMSAGDFLRGIKMKIGTVLG